LRCGNPIGSGAGLGNDAASQHRRGNHVGAPKRKPTSPGLAEVGYDV